MIDPVDINTRSLPVIMPIVFYFQSPDRCYRAELVQDLFQDWVVVLSWSGRHNRIGGQLIKFVEDPDTGFKLMQEVVRKRTSRGYEPITQ